jgi:chromosomal replication initiation ATPase DnaA
MIALLEKESIKDIQKKKYNVIRRKQRLLLKEQKELKELQDDYALFCTEHNLENNLSKSDEMINICCNAFGVNYKTIKQKERLKDYVIPRQCIMYLLYIHFNRRSSKIEEHLTLKKIGAKFSGRLGEGVDHSTVMYAINKVTSSLLNKYYDEELLFCYNIMNKAVETQMGLKV